MELGNEVSHSNVQGRPSGPGLNKKSSVVKKDDENNPSGDGDNESSSEENDEFSDMEKDESMDKEEMEKVSN